jgi:hypothetical protein
MQCFMLTWRTFFILINVEEVTQCQGTNVIIIHDYDETMWIVSLCWVKLWTWCDTECISYNCISLLYTAWSKNSTFFRRVKYMNPLVSTNALQYCQKELLFADINITLTFPIWRDTCTKYSLASRNIKGLLALKRGYKPIYSTYCWIFLSMNAW